MLGIPQCESRFLSWRRHDRCCIGVDVPDGRSAGWSWLERDLIDDLSDAGDASSDFGSSRALLVRIYETCQLHGSIESVHLHVRVFEHRIIVQSVIDVVTNHCVIDHLTARSVVGRTACEAH